MLIRCVPCAACMQALYSSFCIDEEVVCDFEDAMPLENPPKCSENGSHSGPSEACIHRYAASQTKIQPRVAILMCIQQVRRACSILSDQFPHTLR